MKIEDLITLAENRLMALNNAVATATAVGDIETLARLESEVTDTQQTLDKLRGGV